VVLNLQNHQVRGVVHLQVHHVVQVLLGLHHVVLNHQVRGVVQVHHVAQVLLGHRHVAHLVQVVAHLGLHHVVHLVHHVVHLVQADVN
jgi:hypothetical protein